MIKDSFVKMLLWTFGLPFFVGFLAFYMIDEQSNLISYFFIISLAYISLRIYKLENDLRQNEPKPKRKRK